MSTTLAAPPKLVPGEYTIASDASGRWRVTGPDGRDPFPDREFRDGVKAFFGLVTPALEEQLIPQSASDLSDDVLKVYLYDREDEIEVTATLPLELDAFVRGLADQTGVTKGDVIRKAARLLKIAADAIRGGKRVSIIDDKEDYEQDIIGIVDKHDVH